MNNKNMIDIYNVTKTYRLYDRTKDRLLELIHPLRKKYHHEFHALKNISFTIKKGDTVGIIGRNGAGKSTLLKMLTGVTYPTHGKVEVKGTIASLLELGAGFNPELTGLENIYFNGTIMGFTKLQMDAKIENIIDFADIGEFLYQPVKTYSSGMFARLAFSVAINVEPDILIVDEALSVGDIFFVEKCIQKIQIFIEHQDKTLIFVSHDMTILRRLVKRVIWLENASVKMDGESLKVLDEYAVGNASCEISQSDFYTISREFTWMKYKSRFGTGDVTLACVKLNGQVLKHDTAISIRTFDTIVIDISFVYEAFISKNITFSVAFFTKDGINCFGLSPNFQQLHIDGEKGTIRCTLDALPLLRGEYTLSVGAWDKMIVVPYDLHERMYTINVISEENHEDGIFVPKYSWEKIS